ncbi:hypothetical protein Tco_0591896 [Tanacetum coccineum]
MSPSWGGVGKLRGLTSCGRSLSCGSHAHEHFMFNWDERCDTTSVEEIRLKDGVIAKLNSRVFKLEAIIKVLGRERKGVSLRRDEKEKMLKYEEEKKKRRHELMNSDHWKLSVSKISNGKRTQRSNVTPWVEGLSCYNRATDKVHLTDAFDIFLGRQGPLRCRFPWCKDVSVDRRSHDANWAMVGAYFVQLLLQDLIPSWYADGSLYKVSTNMVSCHLHIRNGLVLSMTTVLTYNPDGSEWLSVCHSRLLCAWVLEVNGHAVTSYRMIVSVPNPYSSSSDLGVEANSGSFFVGAFKESLILSNETDLSFHPCVV